MSYEQVFVEPVLTVLDLGYVVRSIDLVSIVKCGRHPWFRDVLDAVLRIVPGNG